MGARARIGSGAIILPYVNIGHDAQVGAGSVVTYHVEPGGKVFGNPAKRMDIFPEPTRFTCGCTVNEVSSTCVHHGQNSDARFLV